MSGSQGGDAPVSVEEFRPYRERILNWEPIERKPTTKRLLQHLLDKELAGQGADLTQKPIAVAVWGEASNIGNLKFTMTGLRPLIWSYYRAAGKGDEIVVILPDGRYRPLIKRRRELIGGDAHVIEQEEEKGGDSKAALVGFARYLKKRLKELNSQIEEAGSLEQIAVLEHALASLIDELRLIERMMRTLASEE